MTRQDKFTIIVLAVVLSLMVAAGYVTMNSIVTTHHI
jgi:hypothetical protein